MKKTTMILCAFISSYAFAGGVIGTNPPAIMDSSLDLMRVSIDRLPIVYAEVEDFRRTSARLGVDGSETASIAIDGKPIQVRRLLDQLVDDEISKVILPKISQILTSGNGTSEPQR